MPQDRANLSLNSWNGDYVDAMHEQWSADPDSVDPQWRQFFQGFELGLAGRTANPGGTPGGNHRGDSRRRLVPPPEPFRALPGRDIAIQAGKGIRSYKYRDIEATCGRSRRRHTAFQTTSR